MNVVEKRQVGEKLPKGWKWVRLEDVIDVRDGTHESPTYLPKGIPFITSKNLKFGQIDFDDVQFISYQDHERFMHRSCVSKGDILYAMIGTVGNPVIVRTDVKFSIKNVALFKFENSPFFNEYFCYLLQSPSVIQQVEALTQGGIQKFVSLKVLRNLLVPLPPLPEQKRIVGILSDRLTAIDKARTATETQLKAAKALPAAYLRQVFDSAEAQKWKIKRLGDVLEDIVAGKSLKCDERPARLDEWGVLKVSAVSWGKFKPEQNKVLPEYFIPLSEHEVKAGDLLISRANTTELVGAVVLVEEGTRSLLMLSDKTLRLIPTTQADKGYLELALRERMAREYIEEHGTGTSDSMKNISQETIRNIPILLPPISKQIEIAEAQGKRQPEIERVIQILQSQLNTINQLSAATLRQAFNGEL